MLILSASIGEGHDLPARFLADELHDRGDGTRAVIADGLHAMGTICERVVLGGSLIDVGWRDWLFDFSYMLVTRVPGVPQLFAGLGTALGGPGLLELIARERPDVVVSTYPGSTEVLGWLRRRGRLQVPVVSAITDLAGLRYWAHPGIDVHLITHPESAPEVRAIGGPGTQVVAVRGLNDPAFATPRDRDQGRRALGLPLEPKLVVVSGGGWAVGDLTGAVEEALAIDGTIVVALCGRNEEKLGRMSARFAAEPRVTVLGFTTQMPDLFAGADALVHSTAGLTVLEALVYGCPTISFGWGRGHIRANNRAYTELGMAQVARDRRELVAALRLALSHRRAPDDSFARLPSAAEIVLASAARGCAH